jgi:hypothetical protein
MWKISRAISCRPTPTPTPPCWPGSLQIARFLKLRSACVAPIGSGQDLELGSPIAKRLRCTEYFAGQGAASKAQTAAASNPSH